LLDDDGNLVFFYTYVIGYEEFFERRLGMDICTVVPSGPQKGTVECELSNSPQLAPGQQVSGTDDVGLYNVANTQVYWASSYAPGRNPYYGGDRTLSTWWEPADGDAVPTYIRGFGTVFNVSAAQINWKELGRTFTRDNAVQYTLEYKDIATNTWQPLVDRSTNTTPHTAEYVTFDTVLTHAVRLKVLGTTEDVKVGIHELNVYGENYTLADSKGMIPEEPECDGTVILGGVDTGVADRAAGDACMSELLGEPGDHPSRGRWVAHVSELSHEWVDAGLLSARERATLVAAAARGGQ
jgi:hypothetical protein